MAADNKKARKQQVSIPPVAIVVGAILAVGLAAFFYLDRASRIPPPAAPPLTGAAKAYVRNLRLADVEMDAHESYMKQSLVEIVGKIGNEGDQNLQLVEINCVFYDAYGQVVLRERTPIVSKKIGGLSPGELKNFRLAFDNVPRVGTRRCPNWSSPGSTFLPDRPESASVPRTLYSLAGQALTRH